MTDGELFTSKIYEDWMGKVQREKLEQILRNVDIRQGAKILDVGSGPGFLCDFIEDVIAVDVDIEGLTRNKGTKVLASGDKLPFITSSFDALFCLDSVHLLSGVEEFGRVLKKDGTVTTTLYCNEYNKSERMQELNDIFSGWEILDEFFVGTQYKEMDAVVVCRTK